MKINKGFTLIELLIFIIVLGITGGTILGVYSTLLRTQVMSQQTTATQTASQCIEWYIGQRFMHGFNSSPLNCPAPTAPQNFCSASGYTVSVNINCANNYYNDPINYKTITVIVTGQGKNKSRAELSTIIAKY